MKKKSKAAKAGRPPKRPEVLRKPTNITLDPKLKEDAKALSYLTGESLSEMTERLLREELARYKSAPKRPK